MESSLLLLRLLDKYAIILFINRLERVKWMQTTKQRYMTQFDRPVYKMIGALVTLIAVSILCFLSCLDVLDTVLFLICPCLILFIWVGIKRRLFWLFWFIPAGVFAAVLVLFGSVQWLESVARIGYSVCSGITCMVLSLSMTREQKRYVTDRSLRAEEEMAYHQKVCGTQISHDSTLKELLDGLTDEKK